MRTRVLIAGAAGRDFHNFNVAYRERDDVEVVAFTATQIPNIDGRVYPAALAGPRYPDGIPIRPERDLEELVREHGVDEVVFAYSDVSHEHVMHVASRALAAGASFRLLAPEETMLLARKPVVAVCAVRTGSGKSQTTRHTAALLHAAGSRVAVIRHPMPYGDLTAQTVQRFARYEDLDEADATIEEREEYEPHLADGNIVYAGVDYAAVLARAEEEADVIVWDGGNNDTPFVHPDVHELRYHPGETNLRMADVCVVNKVNTAPPDGVDSVVETIRKVNPRAAIVLADSPIEVEGDPTAIAGKRVLAVEDGPTLTHGEMTYGAAVLAARQHGAAELVDPRPFAVGSIREELKETIDRSDADLVLIGTPIDLRRVIEIGTPALRVTYRLQELGEPTIAGILAGRGIIESAPALA